MGGAVSSVGNAVNKAINQVGEIGQAIINNPLPIIETIAVTSVLGPEGALATGLTSTQAAAVGAAAVTAANGGNVEQIATAAASAGVGSEVTQLVAPSVTPVEGAATGSTSPVASAAGGAAGGATKAALTGQDVLKGAATGGLVSGGAALGAQEVSALTSPGPMSGTGLTLSTDPSVSGAPGLTTPSSFSSSDTVTPGTAQQQGITKAQQDALQSVFGFGIGTALAPKSSGIKGLGAATTGGGTTGTTSSTTGGAPGGTELDPSTGKAPEAVWGDKYSSLKEGLNL